MKIAATIVLTLGVLILLGLIAMYSGVYNVAADVPDHPLVAWIMKTVRIHSIETRAAEVTVPSDLASLNVEEGFRHYHETCEYCHGAPGVERSEIGKGLYPKPPELREEANEMTPQEIYWIVKHGIKMTGMPSFGATHPDRELLPLVAFVKTLPEITPEEYSTMTSGKKSGVRK